MLNLAGNCPCMDVQVGNAAQDMCRMAHPQSIQASDSAVIAPSPTPPRVSYDACWTRMHTVRQLETAMEYGSLT